MERDGNRHAIIGLLLQAAVLAALGSCNATGLTSVLDGATGSAVSISPMHVVVPVGEKLLFTASDGVSPYAFSLLSGGGTLDSSTGSYLAPSTTGTAVIRVTDAAACTADASLSIVDPSAVPLGIDPAAFTTGIDSEATFSAYGGIPPYAFSVASGAGSVGSTTGLFTASTAAGTTVVRVTDAAASKADATVNVHSAGVVLGIRPATLILNVSGSATFYPVGGASPYAFSLSTNGSGGTVNSSTGVYVAGASAGSDVVTVTDGAGSTVQATVTVLQLATTVDYRIAAVSLPSSGNADTATGAGTFTLGNYGVGPGSQTVSWGAYLSKDATLDSGDTMVTSGTRSALASGATATVTVSGTFPDVAAGSWSWIVVADSSDDVVKTNNSATAALTLGARNVNYAVTAVANTGATASGYALSGSFTLTNNGTLAGSEPVPWTAYLSSNATLETASDTVIASGSRTALAAGGSATGIAFSGTWPSAGTWYLIVSASAPDDTASGDNVGASSSVSVTAPPVDYVVDSVANSGTTVAGGSLDATFRLTNGGTYDGTKTVNWWAYLSTDATLDTAADTLVDSGTWTALTAGYVQPGIAIAGTWPAAPAAWYLIVNAGANDETDSSDNTGVSSATVTTYYAVDYCADTISITSPTDGTSAGSLTWAGTFTIRNNGGSAGAFAVGWTAYLSADTALDGSDTLIGSGSVSALAAGGTTSPSVSGTVATSAGTWRVLIRVDAADDAYAVNDTGYGASTIAIN